MNRRQCNFLLGGGGLASLLEIATGASASIRGTQGLNPEEAAALESYTELARWWQDGCHGTRPEVPVKIAPRDDAFLDDLERRAFRYFWEQGDSKTGLVLDRARSDGSRVGGRNLHIASIAATGFGLSALSIAAERNWIAHREALDRVRNTLRFFWDHAVNVHGWFYHFLDSVTGERRWKSELSSIDTALLLAGVLTARRKFSEDAEIVRLAGRIYERVDFPWMTNGSGTLLSMGWRPESGFLRATWNMYAEETILYLLGLGSPAHPLPAESWFAWKRTWTDYAGFHYLNSASLFAHQYSHAWVDYRDRFESKLPHVNYFINSIAATLAARAFCLSLSKRFPDYTGNVWGVSASDSAHGYVGWGRVPVVDHIDGTVVPCASGGSLMFTSGVCLPALRAMKQRYGSGRIKDKPVWGRYGFVDAFNPLTGWVDSDVLGIDQGITLLSAENARTGNVWRWFMANPEPLRALDRAGLRRSTK